MRSPCSVHAGTQLCLCVSRKPSRFGGRLLHPRTRGVILHLLGAQSAADFVLRSRARAQAKPARLRGAAEPRREKPCPPEHDQRVSWVGRVAPFSEMGPNCTSGCGKCECHNPQTQAIILKKKFRNIQIQNTQFLPIVALVVCILHV